MTTLSDGLQSFADSLRARIDSQAMRPQLARVGRVESVADGVARVSGLHDAVLGERLTLADGAGAYVLSLEKDWLACVLLDAGARAAAGDRVTASGEILRTPVGDALLGRVIDPLGRPLDGGAVPAATQHMPIECEAPAIFERDLVTEPVDTGILAIDALFALGRGQRELIIGDPATGKTALALDAIINQRHSELICIYVAIGQTLASTARVVDTLRRFAAFDRCIVMVASSATSAGLQWMAPFAGMTVAEYFRDRGQHALVVLDDLSKHAVAHRELALLTHQPPGREAYPGDVFYLHARLLERAAQLSAQRGGGSLTALPIAETQAGNLAAYIPTNLISITDGQFVLDRRLFDANHKPAINTGLSVSRIGGKTQRAAMRQAVGTLRLDYAQFMELEQFTRFGTAVDARVSARLQRGRAIRALLAQPLCAPLSRGLQLALLQLLASGRLDGLDAARIGNLRTRLAEWVEAEGQALVTPLTGGEALDDAAQWALRQALESLVDRTVDRTPE